ncbi:hypothetical protein HPB52_017839 [Rhipicephalus sanguineus]|uniref:PIN domain-containing protein n=1 Tax=Rhipicephalus sanguineus TaxID=34632 RepID=A0A9D4QE06_RHISA|nr:hypothetical protein HPB52_017839 [Rhipicephalus sanguineus]
MSHLRQAAPQSLRPNESLDNNRHPTSTQHRSQYTEQLNERSASSRSTCSKDTRGPWRPGHTSRDSQNSLQSTEGYKIIEEIVKYLRGQIVPENDEEINQKAQRAIKFVYQVIKEDRGQLLTQTIEELLKFEEEIMKRALPTVDDKLVYWAKELQLNGQNVVLLSEDVNVRLKAALNDVEAEDSMSFSALIGFKKQQENGPKKRPAEIGQDARVDEPQQKKARSAEVEAYDSIRTQLHAIKKQAEEQHNALMEQLNGVLQILEDILDEDDDLKEL